MRAATRQAYGKKGVEFFGVGGAMKVSERSRQLFHLAIGPFAAVCLLSSAALAERPTAKIVGVGATKCAQFLSDARTNPAVQRDYLAWAQGFISAILLSRPAGTDEQLDLLPPAFPLLEQLRFLQEQCTSSPDMSFSDAVEALYKKLRKTGGL